MRANRADVRRKAMESTAPRAAPFVSRIAPFREKGEGAWFSPFSRSITNAALSWPRFERKERSARQRGCTCGPETPACPSRARAHSGSNRFAWVLIAGGWHTCWLEASLSFHFIVRFEPLMGKEAEFRDELLRVNVPSRAEIGCLSIDVFESLQQPFAFAVHSEWADEASFEMHATLPHTLRFLASAERLLPHPVQGLRLRHIGGGAGAGRG
jgi:quinol monooxygenase YgiN